jgi:hypothetical protein
LGTALITISVYPGVLLDDHWADGSRSEQNLPQQSAWFMLKFGTSSEFPHS